MKYSIIIPTHNDEHTIENTINSILTQSNKNYEIIIVNDASTDNTTDVINKIKDTANMTNIKIIDLKENKKAGGARNEGIKIATGDYIIFLDSDDILENEAIEKISNTIGKDTPDIVYLGFKIKNGTYEENVIPNEQNSIKENRLSQWKYENVWDICWNKDFLTKNNIHFIEDRYFEDFLFYYQGVVLSKTYKFVQGITHIYTEDREGSMTTEISLKKLEDLYSNTAVLLKFMNTIPEKYHSYLLDGIYRNNNYINRLIGRYKGEN